MTQTCSQPSGSEDSFLCAVRTERDDSTTVFVKGFDTSLGENEVKDQLRALFSECGDVQAIRTPKDYESGELKGIGFVVFDTEEAKVCRTKPGGDANSMVHALGI